MSFLDSLEFDERGLIPAVIQDAQNSEVLMFAFTNREALEKTLKTGKMHFYSRSRDKMWLKGEQSGHTQEVVELRVDCDQDVILVRVRQEGGACHMGFRSCFYRKIQPLSIEGKPVEDGRKIFDPDQVYKKE